MPKGENEVEPPSASPYPCGWTLGNAVVLDKEAANDAGGGETKRGGGGDVV